MIESPLRLRGTRLPSAVRFNLAFFLRGLRRDCWHA